MENNAKEIERECLPVIKLYKDKTVERLYISTPIVPPSTEIVPGVSCKDVTISATISARLYLPNLPDNKNKKLPLFIYYHGGYFCFESAFSSLFHTFTSSLASEAKAIVISVEYRLAPEHVLPAAYEDSWEALQWVASHSTREKTDDAWLVNYGDFDKVYIGGDSCGANIVHNILVRASVENIVGHVKIYGALLSHPYFWGSKTIGSESSDDHEERIPYKIWYFSYPNVSGGIDNPMINPWIDGAPSLSLLACSKLLICVSEKDELRERGLKYAECVLESKWKGEIEVIKIEEEGHCFFLFNPETDKAKSMVKRLATFIN